MELAFIIHESIQFTADRFIMYGVNTSAQRNDSLVSGALEFKVYGVVDLSDLDRRSRLYKSTHQMSVILSGYTGTCIDIPKGSELVHS